VERIHDDGEARPTWKRFQMVATLPERDQKAVIRLINSLAAVGAANAQLVLDSHARLWVCIVRVFRSFRAGTIRRLFRGWHPEA
jgi:hypothetical protein